MRSISSSSLVHALVAAALIVAPDPTAGQDEDLVCFVPGECDLSSSIGLKSTDNAEACLLECQDELRCNWFSWEGEEETRCYLLTACPGGPDADACPECVSGEVGCDPDDVPPNVGCFEDGYCTSGALGPIVPADSAEECFSLCLNEDSHSCEVFSFVADEHECHYFSSCLTVSPSSSVDECSGSGGCTTGRLDECNFCSEPGVCSSGSDPAGPPERVLSEAECWDYCDVLDDCEFYTYSASFGLCSPYAECSFETVEAGGEAITSAADCPRPDDDDDGDDGGFGDHCFLPGECTEDYISAVQTDSAEECLEYCQEDVADCNWFSYNPITSTCEAFFECGEVDDSQCSSCVSGQVCECDCGGDGGPSSGRPTKFLIALGRDSLFDIETEFLPSASDAGETGVECSKPEDFPRFMETAVAALIEDRVVLCGGGFGGGDETFRECFRLDPDSNEWRDDFPSLQLDRAFAAGVMVPTRGWWVTGGYDEFEFGIHVSTERYDINNGVWSYGPSLSEPVFGHCAVQVDAERTVVVGGNSDDNEFQIPRGYMYDWAVDDGSTWAVLPALPTGREEPACGAFTDPDSGSTYVLVTGGLARDTGRETDETVVLRMDDDGSGGLAPADQWEDGPELPIAVTGATIIEDQGSLVLVGGNDNDRVFRFLGLDDGWEVVDGLQLSNGDRLFSPAVAVTDEALPGCRET